MSLCPPGHNSVWRRRKTQLAFTITEIMVASAIFSLAVAGAICAQLSGLQMSNIVGAKLTAAAAARLAAGEVRNDVRAAKLLYVGYGNSTFFSNAPAGSARMGDALQIYPTTDTNTYIRYFLDPDTQTLRRMVSGSSYGSAEQPVSSSRSLWRKP